MKKASLGEQELELLQFVTERAPVSMPQVADEYGIPHGLARATIHTVLERLRKKGFLTREKSGGVYQYRPCLAQTELLANLVGHFLQRTLGGSLKPITAYLAQAKDLSKDELRELRALVDSLEEEQEGGEHAG